VDHLPVCFPSFDLQCSFFFDLHWLSIVFMLSPSLVVSACPSASAIKRLSQLRVKCILNSIFTCLLTCIPVTHIIRPHQPHTKVNRSLKKRVCEFFYLTNAVHCEDETLICFFRAGIKEPLRLLLPANGPWGMFCQFLNPSGPSIDCIPLNHWSSGGGPQPGLGEHYSALGKIGIWSPLLKHF